MLNRRSLFAAFAAAALSTPFFASGALAASSPPRDPCRHQPGRTG